MNRELERKDDDYEPPKKKIANENFGPNDFDDYKIEEFSEEVSDDNFKEVEELLNAQIKKVSGAEKIVFNRALTPAYGFLTEDTTEQQLRDNGVKESAINKLNSLGIKEEDLKKLLDKILNEEEDPITFDDLREEEATVGDKSFLEKGITTFCFKLGTGKWSFSLYTTSSLNDWKKQGKSTDPLTRTSFHKGNILELC